MRGWARSMRALFVKVRGARNNTEQLVLRRAQNRRNKMSKVIATPKAPAAVGPYS